jgi:FcoT-like thioesterase domain
MIDLDTQRAGRNAVEGALLERVLTPYKPHCRYLKSGVWEAGPPGSDYAARLSGALSIPSSCYIDDTGHFNSVEFNICYNQLMYVLMAQCVLSDLLSPFSRWTFEEFLRRQLPDVLILDFASRFRRPMRPSAFRGSIDFMDSIERRGMVFVNTRCSFEDDHGGYCEGKVTLTIVDAQKMMSQASSNGAH